MDGIVKVEYSIDHSNGTHIATVVMGDGTPAMFPDMDNFFEEVIDPYTDKIEWVDLKTARPFLKDEYDDKAIGVVMLENHLEKYGDKPDEEGLIVSVTYHTLESV